MKKLNYSEIEGDLISLAKDGSFDVIAHGCNIECTMGAGIAPQMAKAFNCDNFRLEQNDFAGEIDKLGRIDFKVLGGLAVVNAYTQTLRRPRFEGDIPLDYEALTLCLRKINHLFKGKRVGLPKIGCGLAGGDWERVKAIIQKELCDCITTVVIFKSN